MAIAEPGHGCLAERVFDVEVDGLPELRLAEAGREAGQRAASAGPRARADPQNADADERLL